ncbi:hypothetical protein ABZT08_23095 [Streptomyces sp. NPDC005526]|uniref:hypothetical protein n=1 Tax=Streptomyces sp. NPDC005526 TaxID=3156885 RepID=UPI0033A03376
MEQRGLTRQGRRLRAAEEEGPLRRSRTHQAKQETSQASALPTRLADRGRTVEHCRPADLDAWHTERPAIRRPAQTFPRRRMRTGQVLRLTLPPQVIAQDQALMRAYVRSRQDLALRQLQKLPMALPGRQPGQPVNPG